MNRKHVMWKGLGVIAVLMLVGVAAAASRTDSTADRADCPGKVNCPLTGEDVCKDQCPLMDADRADCPGKVKCPLTGEYVCKDKCPLDSQADAATSDGELPACCRSKE